MLTRSHRADRQIYVTTTGARIRFKNSGVDIHGNEYYILSPCPVAKYPVTESISSGDDYVHLSWTILVHGRPFPATSPNKKKDESMPERGSIEELEAERAKKGDSWFRVDPVEHGELLCDWIEYGIDQQRHEMFMKQKEIGDVPVSSLPLNPIGGGSSSKKAISAPPPPPKAKSKKKKPVVADDALDVQPLVREIIEYCEFVIGERDRAGAPGQKKQRSKRAL